jgi:hypothetical protein
LLELPVYPVGSGWWVAQFDGRCFSKTLFGLLG